MVSRMEPSNDPIREVLQGLTKHRPPGLQPGYVAFRQHDVEAQGIEMGAALAWARAHGGSEAVAPQRQSKNIGGGGRRPRHPPRPPLRYVVVPEDVL